MTKLLKAVILRIRFVVLGLQSIPSLHIGDHVCYNGAWYELVNGAYSAAWDMSPRDVPRTHENTIRCLSVSKFHKPLTWHNLIHAVRFIYTFYMINWYQIMLRNCTVRECFGTSYTEYMNRHFYKRGALQ